MSANPAKRISRELTPEELQKIRGVIAGPKKPPLPAKLPAKPQPPEPPPAAPPSEPPPPTQAEPGPPSQAS